MATPTPTSVSQTLTSPILEGSLTAFLKNLDSLQKGAVPSTWLQVLIHQLTLQKSRLNLNYNNKREPRPVD
jgi:hypothetical protein